MLKSCCILLVLAFAAQVAVAEDNSFPSPVKWKPDERAVTSGLYIQPHAAAKKEKVEFSIIEPAGVARKSYPVRGSVPLFRGELADATKVRLLNAAGKEVPVQAKITGFWP